MVDILRKWELEPKVILKEALSFPEISEAVEVELHSKFTCF